MTGRCQAWSQPRKCRVRYRQAVTDDTRAPYEARSTCASRHPTRGQEPRAKQGAAHRTHPRPRPRAKSTDEPRHKQRDEVAQRGPRRPGEAAANRGKQHGQAVQQQGTTRGQRARCSSFKGAGPGIRLQYHRAARYFTANVASFPFHGTTGTTNVQDLRHD
jgi:hypothetical protein